ncbi:MAG: hypothetical protein A2Z37_16565 [Chloroflexi bacterium RBG_19FT_COMBO_62_14]|nr:MAG: hypothetical protein A2Z37_16565 [Chloroflexi bacterium RBG_19FT_COMBO_62_14]
MRMDSDGNLQSHTRAFTKQALVEIYEELSPRIFRYAYRMLGDPNLAEDCVSETFSRFLQAAKNGKGPLENTQGYLFRVAHNLITDHYRRPPLTVPLEHEWIADDSQNPDGLVGQGLERERLRKALLELPDDQHKVIVLRVLEKMSHREVAEILGKTAEATRALQHRALTALRSVLVETEEPYG